MADRPGLGTGEGVVLPMRECAPTFKQTAFIDAYIETGNVSEAYRRAYNTEHMKPATVNRTGIIIIT